MDNTQPKIKHKNLLASTGAFSAMTFISRVFGFVRDIIIARTFGAVAGMDAFFVAFKIPNFMRRLFAEGAFSQAFIPVLSDHQQQEDTQVIRRFICHVAGTLGVILLLLTLVAVVSTPILIRVFAPGFEPGEDRYDMAVYMLRITFPYLMLISLTAMAGAVLNAYGRFAVPAFTPVFLNVALILCALYVAPYLEEPVEALAWGVLIAGVVQLLFQLPFLRRLGLLVWPKIDWRDPGVRRVLTLMVPALFGASVMQLNLLIGTIFASFLPVGSVSWLYYSDRLMNFPLGVFGVAIATVVLPHLSRGHAADSPEHFSAVLDWGLRTVLVIALPAAICLLMLAGPMLATLLGYGEFTDYDVRQARLSLMAFAFGVPAFMLVKIIASGFYARKDIKTPVKVGVVAVVANLLLNVVLIGPLAHAGLALATTLAAILNGVVLFALLYRRKIFILQRGWWLYAGQLLGANSLLVLWLWWGMGDLNDWLSWGWQTRCLHLAYLLIGAMVIYAAALLISGLRPRDFLGKMGAQI